MVNIVEHHPEHQGLPNYIWYEEISEKEQNKREKGINPFILEEG